MLAADKKIIKKLLPHRKRTDNKTAGGRCLIMAGSASMPGAGILAAKGAARVGAGYVYLSGSPKTKTTPPDFILVSRAGKIDFNKFKSVAIGPGLGLSPKNSKQIIRWLNELKKSGLKNVVVDADAITVLARFPELLPLPATWVVTPHAGELSRLLRLPESMEPHDRKKYLTKGQKQLGCHLLLKGSPTYLTDGKKIKTIKYGNKALAKAGTGDVLTGMIAGLMAQGLNAWNAAFVASSIHGLSADDWIKSKDYLSMMPSDLIEMLPQTILKLRR